MKQTKTTEMERRMRKQCIVKKVVKKERKINNNAQAISLSLTDSHYKGSSNYPIISLEKSLNTNSAFKGLEIEINEDVTVCISTAEVTGQVWVGVRTAKEDKVLTKKIDKDRSDDGWSEKSYAQCGSVEVTLQNNDEHIQWNKSIRKLIKLKNL